MLVKEIMERDLTAIEKDETVERFICICKTHGISALPVIDDNYVVVGYISESAIVKAALPGYLKMLENTSFIPDSRQLFTGLTKILHNPIINYMKEANFKVREDDTEMYVADLMIKNALKLVPVVDKENKLIGIIRRIDLLSIVNHCNK